MFNFLKRTSLGRINLYSPVEGVLIPIEEVQDDVFSNKMMGDGYAVRPISEEIYSPVYGTVESIFPTKHAITLKTADNLEILLHMGIDTVELNGEPFEIFVNEGDLINENTKIANIDLEYLASKDKPTDIIVILLNESAVGEYSLDTMGAISRSAQIGGIKTY